MKSTRYFQLTGEREGGLLHLLVRSLDTYNSRGCARLKPGAGNPPRSTTWVAGSQVLEPSPTASQGVCEQGTGSEDSSSGSLICDTSVLTIVPSARPCQTG